MRNIWSQDLTQRYAALEGDTRSKIAIVGGSFAGLATAKYLMDRGYRGSDISIIDGDVIGVQGGRCAGLVVSSTEDDYQNLYEEQGPEEAKDLWQFNVDAVRGVKRIIKSERLNCINGRGSQYLGTEDDKEYLSDEARARTEAGFNTAFGPAKVQMAGHDYAVTTNADISINPAKYCAQLAERLSERGCTIYEKTKVYDFDNESKTLTTEKGFMRADIVVFAGQKVPKQFGYGHPTIASRTLPMETYFLVTEPLTEEQKASTGIGKRSFWGISDNYAYGTMVGDQLLFGGEFLLRPLSGMFRGRKLKRLEKRFRESFPQLGDVKIEERYAGPINTTIDEMPVVDNPEKWVYTIGASEGIAAATTGGRIVADMIADIETENPYEPRTLWETAKMVCSNPKGFAKQGAWALGF